MSIKVALDELLGELPLWGACFLVTVSPDGKARAVMLRPVTEGSALRFENPGNSAIRNVELNGSATLLFAPHPDSGGHSLIVDGVAKAVGTAVLLTPTNAVLHRPAG